MATFKEMQMVVQAAQNRREVLNYIADHLEENFRPNGGPPKNTLLKDDRTPVPDGAFEEVVSDMLKEIAALDKGLKEMLDAEVNQKPQK